MADADQKIDDLMAHREGVPTGETQTLTDEEIRARGRRNIAIAIGVVVFVVVVYLTTMLRLTQNIAAQS